jgi:hypothetical protein
MKNGHGAMLTAMFQYAFTRNNGETGAKKRENGNGMVVAHSLRRLLL